MKLLVTRGNSLGSYLVKLFTLSNHDHTAIWFDDNTVIHSMAFSGVKQDSLYNFRKRFPNYDTINIDVPDGAKARKFALEQVGKKYDWSAIFAFILRRKWDEPDKWFCSELSEAIIQTGGRKRFRDVVSRITPHQSWAVY